MSICKNLWDFFLSLLSQDMGKQARQIEILTVFVFAVLLATALWLWNFKIELTAPTETGRQTITKVNIFELLLSKK